MQLEGSAQGFGSGSAFFFEPGSGSAFKFKRFRGSIKSRGWPWTLTKEAREAKNGVLEGL
jgi:hypothetical protein